MQKMFRNILGGMLALIVVFFSMQSLSPSKKADNNLNPPKVVETLLESNLKATPVGINDIPFQDNPDIYQYDDPSSVVTIYLTVRKGNVSDNSNYTWQQVNDFTKWFYTNNEPAIVGKVDAIVQFGDENGPLPGEVGYAALAPNATVQIRGATSSLFPQKSYKIELLNNAGRWRGQSTINLNKHVFDITRLRNKLSFDLLKKIPNMVSLRTQFVHLYVRDETISPPKNDFADYGLFTQVEQPNRQYLENHLLDRNGQLYKANNFEFFRYPDQIRMADDQQFNIDTFSEILEIKGNNDHSKLIQMLDDVNNYDIPIEETFEKYFNQDNYFTWMAFNIYVGNIDTQNQNFYLYSPQNGIKWYFIPWDYDGAFPLQNRTDGAGYEYAPWANGISNFWGGVLHNRVFRVEKYRQLLDKKIDGLREILSQEIIARQIDEYQPVIDEYTSRMPDIYYRPSILIKAGPVADLLPSDIQTNYNLYLESLGKPMPFYLGTPTFDGGQLIFDWDESFSFDKSDITYQFRLSSEWEFENIVYEETVKNLNAIRVDMLKPGTYFWQVTAVNQAGKIQVPFDYYMDADSNNHYGMKYLYITNDGQVVEK